METDNEIVAGERDRDENALFFTDLALSVKNYLSEDDDTGSFLVEMACKSKRSPFCRRFSERFGGMPFIGQVLLLIAASHFQRRGSAAWHIPRDISGDKRDLLQQESGRLLREGLIIALPDEREIESRSDGGIPLIMSLELASYLFKDLGTYVNFGESFSSGGRLVSAKDIPPKNLYYDIGIKDNVQRLEKAVSPDNYETVMARLAEHGLHRSLTVMLYGPPGTGKTELVWQLARRCGRDVIAADIAMLTGSYVGESERSYRTLFNAYKYAARIMTPLPILLINEADCFLVCRMSVTRSTDKFENNIQTILLEELESFEGILIGTTNSAQNMDPAFDRRFLLKLRIDIPDTDARARIWHDVFPELAEADVSVLADSYRLTGAQIRNVAAQVVIREVLDGNRVPFEEINKMCRATEQGVIGVGR